MSFKEGRIVYLHRALPDPQGGDGDYNRPWIIINRQSQLDRGDDLTIVASTTSFEKPVPTTSPYVPLRSGKVGSAGLPRESVAHCGWVYYLPREDVRDFGGLIELRELAVIRLKVDEFINNNGLIREVEPR